MNKCWTVGNAFCGSVLILAACNTGTTSADDKSVTGTKSDPEQSCDDLSGVSNDELNKRHSLGYVPKSPVSDSFCGTCSLFITGTKENCGECFLFKGPVHAEGYCIQFAPKV